MRSGLECLVLAALPAVATAQVNLGFEELGPEAELVGWTLHPEPRGDAGFLAFGVGGEVAEGERCAQLGWYAEGTEQGWPSEEGWLFQDLPAVDLRGKRVRLTALASVRVSGIPGERGRVVLQVWRRGSVVFEEGMLERPLATDRPPRQAEDWTLSGASWQPVTLYADVPADADSLRVALVLQGPGDAWLDDVRVTVVGAAGADLQPPLPLQGRGLDNVTAFARLLGYVRHFHPSTEAVDTDWVDFAVAGLRRVESAADSAELAARLTEVFAPVAPTVRVAPTGTELETPVALRPPERGFAFVVWWEHRGFGQGDPGPYASVVQRGRWRDGEPPEGAPDPADVFCADLPGGVTGAVPLALYQRGGKTLPSAEGRLPVLAIPRTMRDRSMRLANVVLAWNVLRHFYPYFDRVHADWDATLRTALVQAATDADELELARTLKRMMNRLEDGHGWVKHPALDRAGPRLEWAWIEDSLLVTRTLGEGDQRVVAGDEVVTIDGVPTAGALEGAELLVSAATERALRRTALDELWRGPEGSMLVLELESPAGALRTVRLPRVANPSLPLGRPQRVAQLEPGLWYVDLDRIEDGDWGDVLEDLRSARGILFDQRRYPRQTPVWGHFVTEPLQSPIWEIPRPRRPDGEATEWHAQQWPLPPLEPHLDAELVVLTSERAQSAAETVLSFVEHYELGEIVGTQTAGTNGNVNPLRLPGGYELSWTGMRVRKQDGSPHHGVGILPTVPVERTRQGVIEGRDEVLEAGLRVLRERTRSSAPR